jgi:hypothetical protein
VTRLALGLLVAAGVLAVVSLGLPWTEPRPGSDNVVVITSVGPYVTLYDTVTVPLLPERPAITGAAHPVRAVVAIAALVMWWAHRRGSFAARWVALAVAAAAITMGPGPGDAVTSGRVCYALALVAAAASTALDRFGRRP